MSVLSIHERGGNGVAVSIETSLSNGLPAIVLVGFAGKSLDESKERIRSAFHNTKIPLPKKRITVNISPSDVPKDGAHYDLAIALSILQQSNLISPKLSKSTVVFGELGLDGDIKPVRGILGKLIKAIELGYSEFIIPEENLAQASLLKDIALLPVVSLTSLLKKLEIEPMNNFSIYYKPIKELDSAKSPVDFAEIIGQHRAKRAMEIAAAGGHNILLNGPPGVGKSMLAKALPSVMGRPTHEEIIEITHLHSLTNDNIVSLVENRPFRSPHHSASDVSIIGGGQHPKPGEVSLAHGGVLFLDEFPEFRRSTIESLRQPLEDGVVSVSRAKDSVSYPARFMLVATKNPCPCGYYGSTKPCTCTAVELQRYQKKLSGPILDRIDIHVTVDSINHKSLLARQTHEEPSEIISARVQKAQNRQHKRMQLKNNAQMTNRDIKKFVRLQDDAKELLDTAAQKLDISARVYMKMIKLAQTIADLDDSQAVEKNHIAEALQYRPQPTL